VARYLWASPATAIGLLVALAALALGARIRVVRGTLEVVGGRLPALVLRLPRRLRFVAITFGHVVIGSNPDILRRVRAHEWVHVRQYERWGLLLLPLYVASSLWQLLLGRDPYFDNRFEREAFLRTARTRRAAPLVEADLFAPPLPDEAEKAPNSNR
jgi:hypothetical protein